MTDMWFQIEGNELWFLILDIWDLEIVISGFKSSTIIALCIAHYHSPMCSAPSYLTLIPICICFGGLFLICRAHTPSGTQICLEEIAFFSSVKYDITVSY